MTTKKEPTTPRSERTTQPMTAIDIEEMAIVMGGVNSVGGGVESVDYQTWYFTHGPGAQK
ncbi:MAG: hypothetical protein QM831_02835 [Kofleriaceae bacterium]